MLDINLKQLEVFVTAAEYGSFTRAADVLYLSQSTVSSHIRSLEETLGVLLFDRAARRRVALTEAGKRIYPTAREIVDRCRALQSNLPEREGNLLTVGASTVPAQYLIPRLLADFSRQRPDCQFLLREPVIARETASGTWLETEKWLRGQGILPERLHILARMENPDAIRRAVARGMGVSVLSSLVVEEDAAAGRLRTFELGQGAWRQICMVLPKRAALTATQTAFADFVRQSAAL